jgi:carbamoyltransferase
MRIGPSHPWLGAVGFHLALPLLEFIYRQQAIYRSGSRFARARVRAIKDKIERGETAYLAGVSSAGIHNSGVALVEVTRNGPRLLFNNEEERFSAVKHTNKYPQMAIAALRAAMAGMGLDIKNIDAWFSSWDYAALAATLIRSLLEELPVNIGMMKGDPTGLFNLRDFDRGSRTPRRIAQQLGLSEWVPLIGLPHHDNHAWFSFATSPFAHDPAPVMVAVLDGLGDMGSISLYVCEGGRMRRLYSNDSVFDSLGIFYSVISSTQGGWTWLSSEGRYMGATAYGNSDRKTNPYYAALKPILSLQPEGRIAINRDLANWQSDILRKPYTPELIRILGAPIAPEDMWNPDAVLRIEDIQYKENTQERLDKAAATQMVFEDALMHVIDHFIRTTGSDRLVLTGGIALNALGNMRLLEHFDRSFFRRELNQQTRLHLWVPPTPNDAGVTMGAAYMGAYLAGHGLGAMTEHAFYCGTPPAEADIRAALDASPAVEWIELISSNSDAARAVRRFHGVHDRAGRHLRALPGRRRDRPARARPSLDPRQSVQSEHPRQPQCASEIPRSDPPAGADADAGSRP